MPDIDGHLYLERSVDSISVGLRHRQDLTEGIEPLMASIERLGLLQPVTITPDGVLVCGARRLEAVKRLGWRTLKVWVRSGISDDLNRLLAQQDENEQRKPLNPVEQAALFRELRGLIAEDAARRQEATQFGAGAESGQVNGPGAAPGPPTGHGDSRHRAAVAVTGKASYHFLEQVSAIERIAADRSLPTLVRSMATAELEAIRDGADVKPAYYRVMAAKELIAVEDAATPNGPVTEEEVDRLSNEAIELVRARPRTKHRSPQVGEGHSRRSIRAFLLTWGDLDGWSRYYNPIEIAAALKDSEWQMFERVLAETNAFAAEIRDRRSTDSATSNAIPA